MEQPRKTPLIDLISEQTTEAQLNTIFNEIYITSTDVAIFGSRRAACSALTKMAKTLTTLCPNPATLDPDLFAQAYKKQLAALGEPQDHGQKTSRLLSHLKSMGVLRDHQELKSVNGNPRAVIDEKVHSILVAILDPYPDTTL